MFDHYVLRFESEQITFEIPYSELKLLLEKGDDEEILTFEHTKETGWIIRTLDLEATRNHAFITTNHLRLQWKKLTGRNNLRRAIIATCIFLAAFMLIGLVMSWVGGRMVIHLVNQIAPEKEKSLGDEAYNQYKSRLPAYDNPILMDRLTNVYAELQKGLPNTNFIFDFHLVDQELPNAGSLPGHVFVNRGLFDLVNTPEELAGVLAHEFGHIQRKHTFRLIISHEGPAFVLKTFLGNRDGVLTSIAQNSQLIVGRTFTQEYEREADDAAWDYLVAANINPRGLIDMLEKFKDEETRRELKPGMLSTHPPTSERIKRLEARWNKLPKKTGFFEFPGPGHW
ncbi:MAG: peptidase Ste24p [Pedosphaera sp.]|nr:peptidase Ste24p [Pedosphaera sp.]